MDFTYAQESFPYMRYMQFLIQSHTSETTSRHMDRQLESTSEILNQSLSYIVFAVLLFAAAAVLHEVRKLNPDNYLSQEELEVLAVEKAEKAAKAAEEKADKAAKAAEAKAVKEAAKAESAVESAKLGVAAVDEEVEELAEEVVEDAFKVK